MYIYPTLNINHNVRNTVLVAQSGSITGKRDLWANHLFIGSALLIEGKNAYKCLSE